MRVPRAPFVEAYERSGLPPSEVAKRLGWINSGTGMGDSTRVLRALGLRPDSAHGYKSFRPRHGYLSYDLGVRLARALDVDPVDVGV